MGTKLGVGRQGLGQWELVCAMPLSGETWSQPAGEPYRVWACRFGADLAVVGVLVLKQDVCQEQLLTHSLELDQSVFT